MFRIECDRKGSQKGMYAFNACSNALSMRFSIKLISEMIFLESNH